MDTNINNNNLEEKEENTVQEEKEKEELNHKALGYVIGPNTFN